MTNKLVRKTFIDTVTQYLIDKGADIVDISSPLGVCKLALEKIEEHNKDRFIEQVLHGLSRVDIESLDAVKSLQRLYKSLQVISKATTQDKINRFKKLTINGILKQETLSDNDYEIFLRLTDELTDAEFCFLYHLIQHVPKELSFEKDRENYSQLIDCMNKTKEKFKVLYQKDDTYVQYIQNSLNKYALTNVEAVWGGLCFAGLSPIAYNYMTFIKDNEEVQNAE